MSNYIIWPKDESYPVLVGNSEEGKWYVLDSDVTYTSIEAVEEAISKLNSDKDPKGTKIAPLLVKSTKQTKNSIKITWKKPSGAKSMFMPRTVCRRRFQ